METTVKALGLRDDAKQRLKTFNFKTRSGPQMSAPRSVVAGLHNL